MLQRAEMGCFARLQYGKRIVPWYYNGTQMYARPIWLKRFGKTYVEGLKPVSMKKFQTYAVHTSHAMNDSDKR